RRHTRWPRDWSSDVCSSDLFSRVSLSIKREKLFTFPRKSHVYRTAQFIGIKRMSWLTQLEHHKIGNIDDVVDGTDANALDFCPRSEERRVGKECRTRGSERE